MNEYLIGEYIKKLTTDDIINYAKTKNINISYHDGNILNSYAKKYYKDFLNNIPNHLLREIKSKINIETYKELYKLYLEYKIKYLEKK